MIHVRVPESINLVCPACREGFELQARLLHERTELHCPACGTASGIYELLNSQLRRRFYQAIRDEIENRIHLKQSQ